MEAELDDSLEYQKNQKGNLTTDYKRNGHSAKKLKSQYGDFQLDIPRDRNGDLQPKLNPKYQHDISSIEENDLIIIVNQTLCRNPQSFYGTFEHFSKKVVSKFSNKCCSISLLFQHDRNIARSSARICFKQRICLSNYSILNKINQQFAYCYYIIHTYTAFLS